MQPEQRPPSVRSSPEIRFEDHRALKSFHAGIFATGGRGVAWAQREELARMGPKRAWGSMGAVEEAGNVVVGEVATSIPAALQEIAPRAAGRAHHVGAVTAQACRRRAGQQPAAARGRRRGGARPRRRPHRPRGDPRLRGWLPDHTAMFGETSRTVTRRSRGRQARRPMTCPQVHPRT